MAAIGAVYAVALASVFTDNVAANCDIIQGLAALWHPAMIIFLQVLWLGVFLYTGKSRVTGALLSFHVIKERI
jgi:hypothetical protein